ncbi:MAG: hypothetical protein GWM90_04690 [Gemmatimonadetes bacterium]|nr:hypothetical protein [Gemmatimonadota bacterium]NIQ52995.1 hypothetical protein [Gemmatimonadota bacterium]NIU73139.1 hypothetical protein [Gammaproteobacteria bacterium]NIX43439.1 hypothetical protein [Gemmatimonadota bacterium]NIY07615.1 hypothetical protein [Gemmatimonadota bacterium]
MSSTRYTETRDDRAPLALAAGLVAALLGGLAWAAIVLFTQYEIGWVAWGIGALVGVAMARTTQVRSGRLALAAAVLAFLGLMAGKAFVVGGSAGSIAEELASNPDYLAGPVAWQMYNAGELDAETMTAIRATEQAGDTLSDALWAGMLAQATTRLEGMTEADRRAVAEEAATGYVNQMGLVDGILAQLSGFDLLWLFLAVGTAFQMMNGGQEEPEPKLAAESEPAETEPVL